MNGPPPYNRPCTSQPEQEISVGGGVQPSGGGAALGGGSQPSGGASGGLPSGGAFAGGGQQGGAAFGAANELPEM